MKNHYWLISYKDAGHPSVALATSEKRVTLKDLSDKLYLVSSVSYLGFMSEDTYYKGFDMAELYES